MRRKILFIQHAYGNRGGTESHSRLLAETLKSTFEVSILAYEEHLQCVVLMKEGTTLGQWAFPQLGFPVTPAVNDAYQQLVSEILKTIEPDLVHIHHLKNWPIEIISTIKDHGAIPILYTLHDYFLLTPEFTLASRTDPLETTTPEYALRIFGADISIYLSQRRRRLLRLLEDVSFVAPSEFVATLHRKIFPNKTHVIPHGIDVRACEGGSVEHITEQSPANSFGFMGSFLYQKGFEFLLKSFQTYRKQGGAWQLKLFGGTLPFRIRGVESFGPYESRDLKKIARQFSVGIIPSIFPETFCLTLSELQLMKKPVLASSIGALGERLAQEQNSLLFEPGNVKELTQLMHRAEKQFPGIPTSTSPVRDADSMCHDLTVLYDSLIG